MKKNIWVIICYVLFFVLLLWPLYSVLAYMLFPASIRMVIAILVIVIEAVLGVFCLWWTWKERNNTPRWRFLLLMILISILFAIFLGSVLYIFVLQ